MQKRIWVVLALMLLFTGCAAGDNESGNTLPASGDAAYTAPKAGDYDSADTAVIVNIDEKENSITFLNLILGRHYTLSYDGATTILSKYEEGMSIAQLEEGSIVDVTFLKANKRLNSIQISPQAWEEDNVSEFAVSNKDGDFVIASGQYKITDNLVILSNGEPVEMIDLNMKDMITVRGIEHNIHSIVIEKGHGYLRLANDEYFIGGWIEVGKKLIQPITDNMLLTVPEGSYEVLLTNGGSGGTKEISVSRGEEIELDVGDLKGEEVKTGSVLFVVNPNTAQVYIDGDKVDVGNKVEMEYGIHQLIARAEGYETITQYIKVGQAYASLDIEMEKSEDADEEDDDDTDDDNDYAYGTLDNAATLPGSGQSNNQNSGSGNNTNQNSSNTNQNSSVSGNNTNQNNSVSGNQVTDTTGSYKVKIEEPEGVEVYLDGNYIGIAPVSFKKKLGRHEITLRKKGYETRSYTIQIDSEKSDETMFFSPLEKEKGSEG